MRFLTPTCLVALILLIATTAFAQTQFTAEVRDIGNVFTPFSETQATPFEIDGTYSAVFYDIAPGRGVDSALGQFFGGSTVGVGLTARTVCDDFLITGPAGTVSANVNVRISASAVNRPFAQDISGQITSSTRINQIFTITQPIGDSSDDVDLVSNSASYPVNSPFSFQTQAYVVVGGSSSTPAHSAQLTFGFVPGGEVMTLPGGYSLDSACANIVDNVYLGANPPPVPSFSPLVLSTLVPGLLVGVGLIAMRRR